MVKVTFDKRTNDFINADNYSVTKEGMLNISREGKVFATVACHTWLYAEIIKEDKAK